MRFQFAAFLSKHFLTTRTSMTVQDEVSRLRGLLKVAQIALSTCEVHYTEYNQFEGSWDGSFSEEAVYEALTLLNADLGLPTPKNFRGT